MAPIKLVSILAAATALLCPIAAQTSCGGTPYAPGSLYFTNECYDAIQSCASQFEANVSLVNCNDGKGNIYMQQQADLAASPGSQNNDAVIAFQDIVDLCLLSGQSSGTWGYSDDQWYWIAAEPGCYTNSSGNEVLPTGPPPFCIQDRDSTLPQCYPQPNSVAGKTFKVLKTVKTIHGFTSSGRGWNTYGVQALTNISKVVPSFMADSGGDMTQEWVKKECAVLDQQRFRDASYDLCSLDSGWQARDGVDEHGRITYNKTRFNLPELGPWLHERGLKLGLYIIPGVPCSAENKTILGTDVKVGSVWNGNYDEIFCDWNYTEPAVQQWHDSVVELWASWGVDMIKLDYITPGSPQNGANLVCDNSDAVRAYNKAIEKSGRKMRLDISWKLCRNETWLPTWSSLAESFRTDQDADNYGTETLLAWSVGQRAIDNYRQYIGLQAQRNVPITVHPDMDNLFAANPEHISGINDTLRYTVMNHWLGAGANLILGVDMLQIDDLGYHLVTSSQSVAAANFFADYPMQPRNPGTGDNLAKQLQAWIAGPSDDGEAYVLVVNYGADQGSGGFNTTLYGTQKVTVSLKDLGIEGSSWKFEDIWEGNATEVDRSYTAWLADGASQLLRLTKHHNY